MNRAWKPSSQQEGITNYIPKETATAAARRLAVINEREQIKKEAVQASQPSKPVQKTTMISSHAAASGKSKNSQPARQNSVQKSYEKTTISEPTVKELPQSKT
jgi:hypothetical protein